MFPVYNCNNVMMNITKYKLFPTFLINGRGIITGTSGIKILSFLVYITKLLFTKMVCVTFLPRWPERGMNLCNRGLQGTGNGAGRVSTLGQT